MPSLTALADGFVRLWDAHPITYTIVVVVTGALAATGAVLGILRAQVTTEPVSMVDPYLPCGCIRTSDGLCEIHDQPGTNRPCLRCYGSGWWCVACNLPGPECVCDLRGEEPDAMDCSECQGEGHL